MDCFSARQRRSIMSRIRGKDTTPEKLVRSLVHRLGYRFRLHRRDLPGTPDLTFPKLRKIIFVHGCFWHVHACPRGRSTPSNNGSFWLKKRQANVARDQHAVLTLRRFGWRVLIIWECQLRDQKRLEEKLATFLNK